MTSGRCGAVAAACIAIACGQGEPTSNPGVGGTVASSQGGSSAGGVAFGGLASVAGAGTTGQGAGGANAGGSASGGMSPASGGGLSVTGGTSNSQGGVLSSLGGAPSAGRGGGASMGGSTVSAGGVSASSGGASSGGASSGGASSGGASSGGAKASGGTAGMTSAEPCPRIDAAQPLQMLALSGNLGTHDPTLIAANDQFYLFHTGPRLPTKTSKDLKAWQAGSSVFSANPSWIAQSVPGATDLWAPDISFFGGVYHLYYSASTFGSNRSCIGHATRSSLSSGNWTDHGSLICSNAGTAKDDWNAIDPNVFVDETGTPWLSFGSFWGGIKLLKLNANGERADTQLLSVAARPSAKGALEAPVIVKACGYYYLFVSWDACCASPFDYNIRFGRSTKLAGPYLDKAGTSMLDGGGSLLVTGTSSRKAPGHNAVLFVEGKAYNVYHARDSNNANPGLRIAELAWDAQDWPVSAGP